MPVCVISVKWNKSARKNRKIELFLDESIYARASKFFGFSLSKKVEASLVDGFVDLFCAEWLCVVSWFFGCLIEKMIFFQVSSFISVQKSKQLVPIYIKVRCIEFRIVWLISMARRTCERMLFFFFNHSRICLLYFPMGSVLNCYW